MQSCPERDSYTCVYAVVWWGTGSVLSVLFYLFFFPHTARTSSDDGVHMWREVLSKVFLFGSWCHARVCHARVCVAALLNEACMLYAHTRHMIYGSTRVHITIYLSIVMTLSYNSFYFYESLRAKRPFQAVFKQNTTSSSSSFHTHTEAQSPLLVACIVVTFKKPDLDDPAKVVAHHRMALTFKKLEPYIQGYLATTPLSADHASSVWLGAGHPAARILNGTRTNEFGTPHLSSMLLQTERACPSSSFFVGYANADILFDYGLVHTLNALQQWKEDDKKHRLVIAGQRQNLNLSLLDVSDALVNNDSDTTNPGEYVFSKSVLDKTESFGDGAQDYFLFSRRLLVSLRRLNTTENGSSSQSAPNDNSSSNMWILPDYVIGRRAYDNAIVDWAFHHACLVDATLTVHAVHQTTKDGNIAGHTRFNLDKEYNVNLPGVVYDHMFTGSARYKTVLRNNNNTSVVAIRDVLYNPA